MAKENMKPQKRIDTVPGTPVSIRASRVAVRGKIRSTPAPTPPREADDEDARETIPVPGTAGRARGSHERPVAESEPTAPRVRHDPRREED